MSASEPSSSPPLPARDVANEKVSLWDGVRELYRHMSAPRRRQFFLVLSLMVFGAIAELATIGAVLPFLSLLSGSGTLSDAPWAAAIFDALGASSGRDRLFAATALFSGFAMLAGLIRLQLARMTQNFAFLLGHEFTVEVQRRILMQPYSFHLDRNTSTLLAAIDQIEVLVFELLLPLMQAATAAFIALVIIAALILIDPFTAAVAAAAFSFIYVLVSAFTRRRLAANSTAIADAWDKRLKVVQESLGGIRDVIIDNSQAVHVRLFERVNSRLSLARANTAFISTAPRFLIEAFGMVVIAAIALLISQRDGGLAGAVPILGAVALGAQRLLPLLQQVYNGWSNAAGNRSALAQTINLLRLPATDENTPDADAAPLEFHRKIDIDGVSFAYPSRRRRAIDDVTFEISAGSSFALVGETGSGKSTLADLLMGLLEPDEGRIEVDGVPLSGKDRRRWQRSIAHVPQSIFLLDTTIAGNIAISRYEEGIDLERVIDASRKAQLHEFVMSLPDGYETVVGERGIRLSGGQRQRLGIARAIYKRAPVLILDEATSALDEATEAAVIGALDSLGEEGLTLVVIAHRQSSIAHCDTIVRLHNGRLVELSQMPVDGASAG